MVKTKMYTQEHIDLLKCILRDTIMHSVPKEFPEPYRQGYQDGVYAALQVLEHIKIIIE